LQQEYQETHSRAGIPGNGHNERGLPDITLFCASSDADPRTPPVLEMIEISCCAEQIRACALSRSLQGENCSSFSDKSLGQSLAAKSRMRVSISRFSRGVREGEHCGHACMSSFLLPSLFSASRNFCLETARERGDRRGQPTRRGNEGSGVPLNHQHHLPALLQ